MRTVHKFGFVYGNDYGSVLKMFLLMLSKVRIRSSYIELGRVAVIHYA
jgi:hypothetical protein